MDVKPKISTVVESQLPEFIREDYRQVDGSDGKFVLFLKAYYEFLEQTENRDLKSNRDLDDTFDTFLQYFKNELATNLPNVLVDDRFILGKMKETYLAKGTEASFKLLFRLLYDKEVIIDYPSTQLLKASDGIWEQEVSIFVNYRIGDPNVLVNNTVQIVGRVKTVNVSIIRVSIIDSINKIAELFVDKRFYGSINVGDLLTFGLLFESSVLPTTSKLSIVDVGAKFKVGDVFHIKGPGNIWVYNGSVWVNQGQSGSKLSIIGDVDNVNVTPPNNPQTTLNLEFPDANIGDGVVDFATSVGTGSLLKVVRTDSLGGILNAQFIQFGYTYPSSFEVALIQDDTNNNAVVSITLGPVAKYPGHYSNNQGFLNDAIYIQDGYRYQAYSYILKIDEKLESYKTAVKSLVHPSGMALFGQYEINNNFDVSQTFIVEYDDTSFLYPFTLNIVLIEPLHIFDSPINHQFRSTFVTNGSVKTLNKYPIDNFGLETVNSLAKYVTKSPFYDSQSLSDSRTSQVGKVLNESLGQSETKAFSIQKVLSDTIPLPERLAFALNIIIPTDYFSLTNSGYVEKDPYVEPTYTSQQYSGDTGPEFTA